MPLILQDAPIRDRIVLDRTIRNEQTRVRRNRPLGLRGDTSASLVKIDDSRVGGDTVVPEDDSARFPLWSACVNVKSWSGL